MPLDLPIIINGKDLSRLFDSAIPTIPFSAPQIEKIPSPGSIIYTVWHDELDFIYVGISGIGRSANTPLAERNPRSRIREHSSGRRSGDQFCIYIHDFFVVPDLVESGTFTPEKGVLDRLTRSYIHSHLSYRFLCFQNEDSAQIVRGLESEIQRGIEGIGQPMLNGKNTQF
jgi:hypothetical protein